MAIDLTNGMFALNIGYPTPVYPDAVAYSGSGTYLDPFILKDAQGNSLPTAKMTAATYEYLVRGSGKPTFTQNMSDTEQTLVLADFFCTGKPALYNVRHTSSAKNDINAEIRKPSGLTGFTVADFVAKMTGGNYALAGVSDTYDNLGTDKNLPSDVAMFTQSYGKIPMCNDLTLTVDFELLNALYPGKLYMVNFNNGNIACDTQSTAESSVVNVSMTYDSEDATKHYDMLNIVKPAGTRTLTTGSLITSFPDSMGTRTEVFTAGENYGSLPGSQVSNALILTQTIDQIFGKKGTFKLRNARTGNRATQAYFMPDTLTITMRWNALA